MLQDSILIAYLVPKWFRISDTIILALCIYLHLKFIPFFSIGRHKIGFPQYIHTECSYRMHNDEVKCRNREMGYATEETGKQTSRQEIVVEEGVGVVER